MKKYSKISDYKNDNILNLEKIIEEYTGYIKKIIQNMSVQSLSNEDREEIISDTFFILWKNREKLEDEKLLSSYIAGITKNLVKEKAKVISINYDIDDYENRIFDNKTIDMLYEQREKERLIKKSLKEMKQEDIDIFNLYYYSSKRIKEIAIILNFSELKIKSKLFRIRKKIKKDLEKGGYSYYE